MAAELPVTTATTLPSATPDAGDDPMVGRKVGTYQVVRRIGQGGMGVVYEARHDKLQQRAAIKFLHQELSQDDKILQRFFNEARAISMSRHSSIVTIYDFGQLDDGTAFIQMEYLEGETLLARMERIQLEKKTLGLHMVVELGRQVAAALALIHSKSIVHRDLKPENIFVVPDSVAPLGERVKLLDFGIAKFLEGPVRKTTVGMILGTPLYMSPEQCEGAEDLDAKVDVYSLGIMLFEMVAGHLPFLADTAAALMRLHMFKEPPHLLSEVKAVPPELDELVTRMLAKKAADRPSMEEVAEILEELLPTVATPGRTVTGARRVLSARHRNSQPDAKAGAAADPFAATLGGQAAAPLASKHSARSSGGNHGPVHPSPASGIPLDPLSSTGSGPMPNGSRPDSSSGSQSSLQLSSPSRPRFLPSDAGRTDAVVALARRPVNLLILLALLLGFAVFGWQVLKSQGGFTKDPPPPPATVPPPPVPPPLPSASEPAPAPLDQPAADSHEHSDDHGEAKHHGKKHKKGPEAPAKAEAGEAGAAEGKKARGAQPKSGGEAWDPDKT